MKDYLDHIFTRLAENANKEELRAFAMRLLQHATGIYGATLYTLHWAEDDFRIKAACVADSPEAAAKTWGGEYIPRPGGVCQVASNPDDLGLCGQLRFGSHLFQEMDDTDCALAGILSGDVVYHRHNLGLLTHRGSDVCLFLRQKGLVIDADAH